MPPKIKRVFRVRFELKKLQQNLPKQKSCPIEAAFLINKSNNY